MVRFTEEDAEEIIIPIEEKNHNNDDDDEFEDNNNNVMSSSSKQVSFGIIDETYNGPPSFPLNNRRSSLSRTKTAAKSFREERSLRYSALNKATNNAFVAGEREEESVFHCNILTIFVHILQHITYLTYPANHN